MKNTLILVALISFSASAQIAIPMRTTKFQEVLILIETIEGITKYQLAHVDSLNSDYANHIFFYLGKASDTITVDFFRGKEGGNTALEIPAHNIYSFDKITGRYLDIFPLWKKYLNPDADKILVATKTFDWSSPSYKPKEEGWYTRMKFKPWLGNYWIIK